MPSKYVKKGYGGHANNGGYRPNSGAKTPEGRARSIAAMQEGCKRFKMENPDASKEHGKLGGRPPSSLRLKMRDLLDDIGIERLDATMRGESDANALRAIEIAGKFGMGEARAYTKEEILMAVADAARDLIPKDRMEEFVDRLYANLVDVA